MPFNARLRLYDFEAIIKNGRKNLGDVIQIGTLVL